MEVSDQHKQDAPSHNSAQQNPLDIEENSIKLDAREEQDNLPLNSLKINAFTLIEEKGQNKKKRRWRNEVNVVQKENCIDTCGSINSNAGNERRYGLRHRKHFSMREEDFQYFLSDTEDEEAMLPTRLKCSKCHRCFPSKADLRSHKDKSTNFQCGKCHVYICCPELVARHECKHKIYKKRKKKESNVCSTCGEVFANAGQLRKHVLQHDKELFSCVWCSTGFRDKSLLETHIAQNQCSGSKCFTCDICKCSFKEFSFLEKHIVAHLRGLLRCEHCGDHFEDKVLLQDHIAACISRAGSAWHKCHLCDKVFLHLGDLRIHLLGHAGVRHECAVCLQAFDSAEALRKHRLRADCSAPVHRCHRCGKEYRNRLSYKKHLKSHRFSRHVEDSECKKEQKKFKYECNECGKTFVRLVKLQIHILNSHLGINYQCDRCRAKFPAQEDLDTHVAEQDCKVDGPCTCKVCGKVFAKRDYLKKHEYMHNNVLYKCRFCYYAFMKEKSFLRHVDKMNCSKNARKIRLTMFNFKKCRICEYEFETEELLVEHFGATHPGQNPHQCFCCSAQLPTFRDLQRHIHHHNIQKYTCGLCGKPYTSQEGFRKHRLKHKGAEFKCKYCEAEFLNEGRFKFHERNCKKNPDSGYDPSLEKPKVKKEERPKQSRQLHWESRIIMKHLRGDPGCLEDKGPPDWTSDNAMSTFFEESDLDGKSSGQRGWFDNYYKTEEDDIAFAVRKDGDGVDYDSDFDVTEFLQTGCIVKKKAGAAQAAHQATATETNSNDFEEDDGNDANGNDSETGESSAKDSSDEDEEEEQVEAADVASDSAFKKCRICFVTYSQEYELLHHFIKFHGGQLAHQCPHCVAQFPLLAQLKEHMKVHGIGMGVFNCDNCSKKFRSEKKMKAHNYRCKGMETEVTVAGTGKKLMVQLKMEPEDYCKRCCKQFQTKCGYRRHKLTCKGKRKKPNESKKKTARVVKKVEEQIAEKSDDDEWRTNDASVDSEDSRDAMRKETEEKEKEKEAVPVKEERSAEKSSGKGKEGDKEQAAKDGYTGDPPLDSFPCRMCDKKFQYERGIVMHFKMEHPGHKALICHVCNMHLADKLKEHLKTHGIGEEFICELCSKRFNQKFLSKIHEMWHQGIEYKCGHCKQKFLNKEKMDKHVNEGRCSNRQSLMRLPCDLCGKSYRSKFGLSKHYMTHTPKELRPVKNRMNCEYCGKWFENNNGLQRHRRIHTGERPFCCRFCPKAFAQEGNCKAHERIHTGESKPRKKNAKSTVDLLPLQPQDPVYPFSSYMPNPGVH